MMTLFASFRRRIAGNLTALLVILAVLLPCAAGDNLLPGIPGPSDQVVDREGYALGFCDDWKVARWVAYRLTAAEVQNAPFRRVDDFRPDPEIRNGSAALEDYRGSGFDRGHLAPAADMKWSAKAMSECFYLSNMAPQNRDCNAGIWNEIENTVRGFACAERSIFIVTGPVVGRSPRRIGPNRVAVPDGFYKVVCTEAKPRKIIAFYVPNRPVRGTPRDQVCSVREIEQLTGLRFFTAFPELEALKETVDTRVWDWSKSQSARPVPAAAADSGGRREYRPGSQMPVSSRPMAPVCAAWPDTGYWLSTGSQKRHNRKCENYRRTRGYPCRAKEGKPCGLCGG